MVNLDQVFNLIYSYYPRGLKFSSSEYQLSPQFKRLKEVKRKNYLLNQSPNINEELQRRLKKYVISDWTDLDSSNGYEFRVLLHKNQPILDDDVQLLEVLEGTRIDLYLFASVLYQYYYFFVCKKTLDFFSNEWKFENTIEYNEEIQSVIDEIRRFFNQKKYEEISKEIAEMIIKDVETEYLKKGEVRIFNCLFTELIKP